MVNEVESKKSKRPLIGYILLTICCVAFLLMTFVLLLHYYYSKFSLTLDLTFIFIYWDLVIITLLGISMFVFYLVSTIKTEVKKTRCIVTVAIVLVLSIVAGTVGVLSINGSYEEYKTWTSEKWAEAKDNSDYRGLLSESFLEQYNLEELSGKQVEELLGEPDSKMPVKEFDPKPHAYVSNTGNERWIYNVGYHYDFMDPSTFEIYIDSEDNVYKYEIVYH
ncbi:MAG: hypothetical protein K6F14_04420 [Clostridiales bacterium]|nr:hypothetical protein [Clostridiales bacterium]